MEKPKNQQGLREVGNKLIKNNKNNSRPEIQKSKDNEKLIDNIHHLLWTHEGLSPEKAIEQLQTLLFLRLVEPHIKNGSSKLSVNCKFSRLVDCIKDNKNGVEHKLFEIYEEMLDELYNNNIAFFREREIKKYDTLCKLVKNIEQLINDTQHMDLLGYTYENMMKHAMVTISDDGQYFTERSICAYAIELAEPKLVNGKVPSMIDPFCGTGGFISSYIKYMNTYKTDKLEFPSGSKELHDFWNLNQDSIFGIDFKRNSILSTLMNLMVVSGHIFDKNNLLNKDSFTGDEKTQSLFHPHRKFKYIFTNPPFGGDKTKGKDYKFKYGEYKSNLKVSGKSKLKSKVNYVYHVCKEIQMIDIPIDDKVAAAVQLCMALLDDGGVCGIVLPEGFFFLSNKNMVLLRKKLVEEYNVKYIVDIQQKAFENTSTKTCLMIFTKNGTTKKVEFIDFINRYTESRTLGFANIDDLRGKSYSLNYKRYIKQEWNLEDGYKLVKLGDIIEIQNGKRIVKNAVPEGDIPVYGGGDITFYTNSHNRDGKTCKISREGMSEHNCVMLINGSYFLNSQGMTIISSKPKKVLSEYIWYYLLNNKKLVFECGRGTAQKAIDMDFFKEIEIPLPSLEHQKEIVKAIDNYMERVNHFNKGIKLHEQCMINDVELMYRSNKCQMMKLKDIADITSGKFINKENLINGCYPVVGGGINSYATHNEYNCQEFTITISRTGTCGYINMYDTKIWAISSCGIIKEKNVSKPYLYYFLKYIQEKLMQLRLVTAHPNLDMNSLKDFEIPVPPLEIQKQLEPDFEALKMMKERIKYWKTKANELIQQLSHQTSNYSTNTQLVEHNKNIAKSSNMKQQVKEEDILKAMKKLIQYDIEELIELGLVFGVSIETNEKEDIILQIINCMIDNDFVAIFDAFDKHEREIKEKTKLQHRQCVSCHKLKIKFDYPNNIRMCKKCFNDNINSFNFDTITEKQYNSLIEYSKIYKIDIGILD